MFTYLKRTRKNVSSPGLLEGSLVRDSDLPPCKLSEKQEGSYAGGRRPVWLTAGLSKSVPSVREGLVFLVHKGVFSVCCFGTSLVIFLVVTLGTVLPFGVGPSSRLDVHVE